IALVIVPALLVGYAAPGFADFLVLVYISSGWSGLLFFFFFFSKQKPAYEITLGLGGGELFIRDGFDCACFLIVFWFWPIFQ
ncbi:hypothetical protein, partial [Agrobacterium vitis]|uniref:hypothetical protein n=1 Tax=Agrobacterium vitis TaxID=373 RepID=UPI001AEDDC31